MKTSFGKWLVLHLFLIGALHHSKGQIVDFKWGEQTKHPVTSTIKMYTGDEKGVLVLRTHNRGSLSSDQLFLEYNDYSKAEMQSHEIVLKKQEMFLNILNTPNGIILLKVDQNKETNQKTLIGQLFSKMGKPISEEKKLYSYTGNSDSRNLFLIRQSHDLTKMLITGKSVVKGGDVMNLKVIDDKMNLVWEEETEFYNESSGLSLESILVDDDGDLVTLSLYKPTIEKSHKYMLSYFDSDSKKWSETDITLDGINEITNSRLLFDKNSGKLIFSGFYSNKTEEGLIGFFFASIDYSNLKVEKITKSPFTSTLISKTYYNTLSESQIKKKTSLPPQLNISRTIIKPDGGVILIGQIHTRALGERSSVYYNFINMVILDINADGTLRYSDVINTHQYFENETSRYGSFFATYHQNKLYFLFNDHPDNYAPNTKLEKRGKYSIGNYNKSMLTLAVVEIGKEITYKQLPSFNQTDDLKCTPAETIYLSHNKFVAKAQDGNKFKFGILTIGE